MPPKSNMPKRHNFYCIVYLTFGQYAIRSLSFFIHTKKDIRDPFRQKDQKENDRQKLPQ